MNHVKIFFYTLLNTKLVIHRPDIFSCMGDQENNAILEKQTGSTLMNVQNLLVMCHCLAMVTFSRLKTTT